jgi:SAM-dependent methyltransferase
MPPQINFAFLEHSRPINRRVEMMLSGCAHYRKSDLPLFIGGYNELCREDMDGGKILEICCGAGELAKAMARAFPKSEVIAMDRYMGAGWAIKEAEKKEGLSNARYQCGDALRLTGFSDASLDLVYGQATLHHLAHEVEAVRSEFSRVLKPGGRLIFIYEPLGHNPLWAMIRAWRITRSQMVDESNVFVPQLESIAQSFTSCRLYPFNLLGYPLKSLGRFAGLPFINLIYAVDVSLMKRSRAMARMAANFNIVFTK